MGAEVQAGNRSSREINQQIKNLIRSGETQIRVRQTQAQHNLAVGILSQVSISFEGSVGYYCGGLMDGPDLEILGSAGWGLGESMASGTIQVTGNAGNGCGASIRGGTLVVRGSTAARAGISMKGGLLIIGGNCGYMTGFMSQKGTVIVCGNAGPGLGDSMYEGRLFIGGEIQELGNDAVVEEPDQEEWDFLTRNLAPRGLPVPASFKKVVSGRRLWNFNRKERDLWKEVL
jgi:glutamate synthase domain-containing protein 3